MTKLSELHGTNRPLFLVKFSNSRERLASLQAGRLYMNNFRRFVEIEKIEGKKGMGDIYEASHVLNEMNIRMMNYETNELFGTFKADQLRFAYNSFLDAHVFCTLILDANMFEVTNETDDYMDTMLVLTDEQRTRFVEDFGEHVFIIRFNTFCERVDKVLNEKYDWWIRNRVQYDNFSVNNSRRLKSLHTGHETEVFFWKDSSFAYQNEFRYVIIDEGVETPLVVDVGDLSDVSEIMSIADLSTRFGIRWEKSSV